MIQDPLFYAAAVPAVILLGLAKGGFSGIGLLSLPLMALVISPLQAAAISLPILMVQDVVSVGVFWRHADWRGNLRVLLPAATVGIVAGYAFAAWVSEAMIQVIVGFVALSFAVKTLWTKRGGRIVEAARARTASGLFWGFVSGFTSTISNAGGPPFQVHVLPQRLPRDAFVGTGAVFFGIINWIKVPAFTALGLFTAENLKTSAALFPLAIASTAAGVWLVRRVSGERLYDIVNLLLIVVGLKLLFDGARALLA